MKSVKVKELSLEAFLPYGRFADMVTPVGERMGSDYVHFFRDMLSTDWDGSVAFSTCRVLKRELVIFAFEYHNRTAEGILPLDNDILIHVAPATRPDGTVPVDKVEVFRVPKGTMVVIRPGVWHHAPYTPNDQSSSVLIVLPERTYANDCECIRFEGDDRIAIEL